MKPEDPHNMEISEQAAFWLSRMHSREATSEDQLAFEQWLALSPDHDRCYCSMLYFWDAAAQVPEQQLRSILASRPAASPSHRQVRVPGRRQLAWALAGGVCASVSALFITRSWWVAPSYEDVFTTTRGERRSVDLPDGSVLHLNTGIDISGHSQDQQDELDELDAIARKSNERPRKTLG